jgi:co-chaperonin GroES (HSP10)
MSKESFSAKWDDYDIDLVPVEYKVIVLPDKVEEKAGGGIIDKPQVTITQEQRAQVRGLLVAVSEMAFSDWDGEKPKKGQRVYFAKYAGIYTEEKGPNGVQYRIINDKDIACIIRGK